MPRKRWGSTAQLKAQHKASLASAARRKRIATLTRGRSEPKKRVPQGKLSRTGDRTPVKIKTPVAISGPRRKPDAPKLIRNNPEQVSHKMAVFRHDYIPTTASVKHVNKQIRRQSVHLWLGDRALKLYDKLNG